MDVTGHSSNNADPFETAAPASGGPKFDKKAACSAGAGIGGSDEGNCSLHETNNRAGTDRHLVAAKQPTKYTPDRHKERGTTPMSAANVVYNQLGKLTDNADQAEASFEIRL
jgi:hypothetical protein